MKTPAQIAIATRATARYKTKTYQQVNLHFHIGKKDIFKAHAAAMGESLNAFVARAIEETMERDRQKTPD